MQPCLFYLLDALNIIGKNDDTLPATYHCRYRKEFRLIFDEKKYTCKCESIECN